MSNRQQQKIVQYLNEAHGVGAGAGSPAAGPDRDDPPGPYRDGLETHLQETRRHAERLERRLIELGRATTRSRPDSERSRALIGQALALTKTPLDLVRGSGGEEKVLKNAKDSCAAEAQEIATYTALARLARTAATPDRAAGHVGDGRRAADARPPAKEIPRLTDAVARAEFDGDGSYDVTETGAADAVREVGSGQAHRSPEHRSGKRTARQARKVPGRGACRGHGQGSRGLRVGPRHRELRLAQRRRGSGKLTDSPRSTWPRSTPTSARTRTAPRSPAGSTRCRPPSRGPDMTSWAWTRSVPRCQRATRRRSRRFAATSASTRTAPGSSRPPSASSATPSPSVERGRL